MSSLVTEAHKLSDTAWSIASYIAGALLAIGLITVIWSIVTNKPHAWEWLIAWFVAVIFTVLFIV